MLKKNKNRNHWETKITKENIKYGQDKELIIPPSKKAQET